MSIVTACLSLRKTPLHPVTHFSRGWLNGVEGLHFFKTNKTAMDYTCWYEGMVETFVLLCLSTSYYLENGV